MQIINGRILAEKIKDEIIKEIAGDKKGLELINCARPNLAIVLVGHNKESELYVSLKEREAKKVGIDTHLYRCEDTATEEELLEMIKFLNNDETIDAILVQLPLPELIDTDKIIEAIRPEKDVDGFHPDNLKSLLNACDNTQTMPPVFEAVLEMLKSIKYDMNDERVCILANSDIFGESLAKVLKCQGAKVEVVKGSDAKLKEKISEADLLITALGKPKFINGDMIKKGVIIIDIGTSNVDGKIYGDVDFDDVDDMAAFITPVPGGVGPMTIACALKNTLELYKRRCKK